jgi:hypothetical protein
MLFIALAVILITAPARSNPQGATDAAVIRTVRVENATAPSVTVLIEASGPLAPPRLGTVDGPPRIYLDFAGARPATRGTSPPPGGFVRRLRVALYEPRPPVTRVVIDLSQFVSHRLDTADGARGRVRVILFGPPGGSAPSSKPPPETHAEMSGKGEKTVALAALERLERLRPLLASIDSRVQLPGDRLQAAAAEFEAVRQSLTTGGSLTFPEYSGAPRQLLAKICVLGNAAATAQLEAAQQRDDARLWNAASAAAGALILLDRASSDVRPVGPRR